MPPRSNNKKLKLMAAESGEDRISALSDTAIHRVLSFLPAHEAVQTCLLSRRWREIWKSMPVLRVDFWFGFEGSSAEFNKFVNHLLFFRDQTPLDEFEVKTYNSKTDSVEPTRYLQMWIRYALMRNVLVLRVRFISLDKPPRFFIWPLVSQHLMTLQLSGVVLDGCSMDFSRCPFLEDLEISRCRISPLKMSSQSIRRLWIRRCEFPNAARLQLLAPNLFALGLERNDGPTPFLGSLPLLVEAVVALERGPSFYRHRCRRTNQGLFCDLDLCIDCYGSEKCVVLGGLSNATKIELRIIRCQSSENIFKQDLKWCPPFSKLKTLILNGWVGGLANCDVRGLICFLQLTPILENLILDIHEEFIFEKKIKKSCSLVEQFIPSEHLKIVQVICYKYVTTVHKLVETLIACGIPTDIISIRRTGDIVDDM